MGFLRALVLAGLLPAAAAAAADPLLDRFAEVDAAPVKTWVYVGTVTLTPTPFRRGPGVFTAGYTAKVFPYFFYNEAGRMTIDVSDAALREIAAGRPIDFTGRAVRSDGDVRRVDGRAIPTGASTGRLTVRIHVSRRINLSFESTYRLPAAERPRVKATGTR